VVYRLRIYQAVPEKLAAFHQFFREQLLPIQLRHGARLVGRWETEDARVIAIWEYDSAADYEQIRHAVNADPDAARTQELRKTLDPLFTACEEVMMVSTLARD
jgi:NIPSNAP